MSKTLTYDQSKKMSQDSDPRVREALAVNPETQPELLYYLAADENTDVRRGIARNDKTPRQADLILANDESVEVRCDLAEKIARLTPGMSKSERDKVYDLTLDILDMLVKDQAVRVREVIADTLKEVTDAPSAIINDLARDTELAVCAPVLRLSPVLTDEDLLDIIETHKTDGARTAISQRRDLSEALSDAIHAFGDSAATAALLANSSAQIREETLDRIIEQAPEQESWHSPLVKRPWLPVRLAAKIASFVSDSLLREFRSRTDFDAKTMKAIETAVDQRLKTPAQDKKTKSKRKKPKKKGKSSGKPGNAKQAEPGAGDGDDIEEPADRARELFDKGELDEEAVWDALGNGDRRFVVQALSLKAGLGDGVVPRAFELRSAKGLTALVWKCGFGPNLAAAIQGQMGGIAPSQLIKPAADGDYALDEDSLNWQIEFLSTIKS